MAEKTGRIVTAVTWIANLAKLHPVGGGVQSPSEVMLAGMNHDGDLSATADASGGRKYHGRATAWVFTATVSVLVLLTFELVLYVTAVMLFSHVDTPDCASTNSFCSPDGHSGLTGGAIFLVAGNFIAAALAAALLGRQKAADART